MWQKWFKYLWFFSGVMVILTSKLFVYFHFLTFSLPWYHDPLDPFYILLQSVVIVWNWKESWSFPVQLLWKISVLDLQQLICLVLLSQCGNHLLIYTMTACLSHQISLSFSCFDPEYFLFESAVKLSSFHDHILNIMEIYILWFCYSTTRAFCVLLVCKSLHQQKKSKLTLKIITMIKMGLSVKIKG